MSVGADLLSDIRREIDERLRELRPALAEYERLLETADALGLDDQLEAILGALEHGSHTVGELAVVTAMRSAAINGNLRRLATQGLVTKTEREGKLAWSLATGD